MSISEKEPCVLNDEDALSLALIEAQYQLWENRNSDEGKSVLILLSGVELAGKGEAVKQLREWVDPRYLFVKADMPQLMSTAQPFWQRYARYIPKKGQIRLLFGNWYGDALVTALQVADPISDAQFQQYLENIVTFEKDLCANQVHVVKIWIDLSWTELQKRLDKLDPSERQWQQLHGLDWRDREQYEQLQKIRKKFTTDWIVIDGKNSKVRDQKFAQTILETLKSPLAGCEPEVTNRRWRKSKLPEQLVAVPSEQMEAALYKKQLKKLTKKVTRALCNEQRNVLFVFEGMDAAGKGGSIKRMIKNLDPREYEIHTIAAPEPFELSRPYLWRFWCRIAAEPEITVFDRSWYGRVLVERLEGLAKPHEWKRAYAEINRFEQSLIEHNSVVIKFWLAIDKDEQEKRFIARQNTAHKRFKITEEDWRNRKKWSQYLQAAADMFEKTSSKASPWYIVSSNDKYTTRIQVLQYTLQQLKRAQ